MNKICKCLSFVTLNIQQFVVPWWETSHHVQWFTEHGVSENEFFLCAAKVCITLDLWNELNVCISLQMQSHSN